MIKNRKINLIVIHCSATRVTQDFTVGKLEACHLARGFRDIGYHYYITKDGVIYPCRPESEPGAHARHYNARKYRHLLRGWSGCQWSSCRHPHASPEGCDARASEESLYRLS